jgi:hypothetical protein
VPEGVSVVDAVSSVETDIGNVEEAIDAIDTALNTSVWDITQPIELYYVILDDWQKNTDVIRRVSFTGNGMFLGKKIEIPVLKGGAELPGVGDEGGIFSENEDGEITWGGEDENDITSASIISSFRTSLNGKSLTNESGRTVNFSEGAYSYTYTQYDSFPLIPSS